MEVLLQLISEYFMGPAWLCNRLFEADDGAQTHLCVHIFMDGRSTVAMPCPLQISDHAAVAVHLVMAMVDAADLLLNLRFSGIIIRPPMLPVVVVCIGADRQSSQQPADAE